MIPNNELFVYYGSQAREKVQYVLEATGIEEKLPRSATIGLKPNLVLAKPSTSGATTDPELVAGIVQFFMDRGFKQIKIMESSWLGANTEQAFQACGYDKICREFKVPFVDLKKDAGRQFEAGDLTISVAKSVLEVDFLINVPVLKAHCQAKLTCALKNLKGCIPDREKRRFHALGLHEPIARLNTIIKTGLVVVDGIIGDLTFEEGGNPVHMNRIIAGEDPVCVDAYACELLGYETREVEYIGLAESLGVGSSKGTIKELNEDNLPRPNFKPSPKVRELSRWVQEDQACSACYGSLLHALQRLHDKGKLGKLPGKISIGQGYKNKNAGPLGVGICTRQASLNVPGCPPSAAEIIKLLEKLL